MVLLRLHRRRPGNILCPCLLPLGWTRFLVVQLRHNYQQNLITTPLGVKTHLS
jgi:hypothetical protein